MSWMYRFADVILAAFGLALLFPVILIVLIAGVFDTGSPVFFQERVGRYQKPFTLIKFRTMRLKTESAASHLVGSSAITPFGSFLRKTKLDELPQLINVLGGDMSLVGPRPCLFNQEELIRERERLGVFLVRPGITGLGQLTGVDMSTPKLLAETDAKMIRTLSLSRYFTYILHTALGKGAGDAAGKLG